MNEENKKSWLYWCRLCAKMDIIDAKPVLGSDGQNFDPMLVAAIGKHFWVNISADDQLPQRLCNECLELLSELQKFAQHVTKVQTMFYTLKTVDLNDLEKQNNIRVAHGIGPDNCHFLHKNCGDQQETATILHEDVLEEKEKNAAEEEEEADKCEKENIMYEIIEFEEDKADESVSDTKTVAKSQKTKENVYSIVRKKRQAAEVVNPEEKPAKRMKETVKTVDEVTEHISETDEKNADEENEFITISEIVYEEKNETMNYECKICLKKYKMLSCYKRHMLEYHNKESNVPDFQCKCGKKFSTERQLQIHERIHLPLEQKSTIPCPYCNKKFTKTILMQQHIRGQHLNMKPFICDECGKPLKTMAALNEHKLVHTNDCPFECDVCHKRFKNKARLKTHSDVHTESYNCNVCGLILNTRRTLRMHMLVHSEEKQYKCDFCSQAFKRGKALKNHLILHTGLRPFKCTFCGRAFANNSNCRAHKKKMHPQQLAKEEAEGVKPTAVVPRLDELRSSCLNINSLRQKEAESASQNVDNFVEQLDDLPNDGLEEQNKSPIFPISIDKATESEDDVRNYPFSDEEFLITTKADEEEEDEGTETIMYEVLNEL